MSADYLVLGVLVFCWGVPFLMLATYAFCLWMRGENLFKDEVIE